ncbi:MAG: SDR family oxidoreductase, partial [Rubrobacteraceae bacterium]
GRVALVTGGGKGIGGAIAKDLAAAGAEVAVNYTRGADTAAAIVEEIITKDGKARAFEANVGSEEDVIRLFAEVREAFGPVDTLVNNAGVWHYESLENLTVDEYRRHYDVNVLGYLLTSREFARQEEADGGAVVNLTSVGIHRPAPTTALYTGTKWAIVGMTQVLAMELAPRGIRVNAIAAGLVDTEGTRASGFMGSPASEAYVKTIPLGRVGRPEDIAPVATFLVSDDARFITGDTVSPTGGQI